jgi:8-oxo-dGTP pyrophosphatase MutT (NUDIX family)
MWIDKKTRIYRDNFDRAKKKYDCVKHLIPNIIDTTQTHVKCAPWGFPKGKKNNYKEEDYECAIRETTEETRIPSSEFEVMPIYKYHEKFQGTDGIHYSTCYFLGKVFRKFVPEDIQLSGCIRKSSLSEEVNALKWVTYEEAKEFLNPKRQLILQDVLQLVKKHYLHTET